MVLALEKAMRRRDFITGIAGSAAAWPLAARAQQPDRMRRIGVLMNLAADDAEGQARLAAFVQGLQQLGWTDGRNARIDIRWAAGVADRFREYAAELVALAPDVILASGAVSVAHCYKRPALSRSSSRMPPIRSALVSSLAWRGRAGM